MATKTRRYGGLLDHERRAERRARLLDTGLELFGTIGYGRTTIPLLCSRARIAARHFYEEFDSREALLREIYDGIAAEAVARVRAALRDRGVRGIERIRRANAAYFSYLTADPRRARIYALESMGVSAEMEQYRRATRERFIRLNMPEPAAVLSPLEPRLLTVSIAAAAHGLLLEWVMADEPPAIETMTETMTMLWIRTLRGSTTDARLDDGHPFDDQLDPEPRGAMAR